MVYWFCKRIRRVKFLAETSDMVPWAKPTALFEPAYPDVGDVGGRAAAGVEQMLRMHCPQLLLDVSDPAVEEALHASTSMCGFVGIDRVRQPAPDGTTAMRTPHLRENSKVDKKNLQKVGRSLDRRGLGLAQGRECGPGRSSWR